jgi:hypothetical protein
LDKTALDSYHQVMPDTFPLVKWDSVESALLNAQSFADLNSLRSKMETLHILLRQSHQSLATQNKIASNRLRVDRKRGEWLQENIENGGDRRSVPVFADIAVSLSLAPP